MKFPKVIGKRELMHAAIIGSVAGLAGVIFFIILLNSMNSSTDQANGGDGETVPVQATEESKEETATKDDKLSVEFFANQYGVFKSNEAATEFISQHASLNTSAIVEVDGNYYVWSSITPVKEELILSENPTSFAKTFRFSGAACSEPTLQNLPTYLKSNDPSKFYFEEGNVPDNVPQDWQSITSALSSFSQDLGNARLHLIAHYFSQNDCMKIEF
ncbi:hypothetical protein ACH0B5_12830 [Ureibacillus sp. 179-F W5.1 NHS]|uniref:Uncharacterized protein n=1 Tax=Lysinibacillus halotolerans TaxID=1368476 RepID=A0A3M8HB77_9BACI|nr:hypothetical protein [Lysinibacillus halotolerans]RNC99705.1 hypothetical protein EC501_07145 [Lysinibacillus halotolerans]